MLFIWFSFFVEIIILAVLKPIINDYTSIGIITVLLHSIISVLIIMGNKSKFQLIFLFGFLIRLFVLFFDLYGRGIFILPNSGSDSEMYYQTAVNISNDLSLFSNTRGGTYSDIMGVLFYLIGPQRIVGQYLNLLLGFSIVSILKETMILIGIKEKWKVLFIAAFFPTSIIMSVINLREIFPTFFIALSIFFFIKWYKENKLTQILFSFILLGLASAFHAGVIGIAVGYVFAFLFYKAENNKFQFSKKTVLAFAIIIIISVPAFTVFNDLLFRKFQNVEELNDIIQTANPRGMGGATYLTGIQINNLLEFIIYSPIKSIYFLFSPLPMDWRGIRDIISFLTDSLFYLIVSVKYIKLRKTLRNQTPLAIIMVIMIVATSFIFGVGVSNAGTAMRHRQKIIPLFLIMYGIVTEKKKRT